MLHRAQKFDARFNFWVDSTPLFDPKAKPFTLSILETCLTNTTRLDMIKHSDGHTDFAFGVAGSSWRIRAQQDDDIITISTNYQSERVLHCTMTDFTAGIRAFLDDLISRLFIHAPRTLDWIAFESLSDYLRNSLSTITSPDPRGVISWSPDEIDWDAVNRYARLNPPGSSFDEWGEAPSVLFGSKAHVEVDTIEQELITLLVSVANWWPISRKRLVLFKHHGLPREDALNPRLRPEEQHPLLDLALQLAAYSRTPNLFGPKLPIGGGGEYAVATAEQRRLSGHGRSLVLDPIFLTSLETALGRRELIRTANHFIGSFVREVYAREPGAIAWQTFRPLRRFAFN